jgi:tRNA threonylcarbamoyladenosine biosynthesis protein TsaB
VIVLALDTTTRSGSVAVVEDRRVRFELRGEAGLTHGERLPGDLKRALDGAGVSLARLQLLAVAAGPGGFTGLRVGIAAMQGLATGTGLRIVPVSTLDALARASQGSVGRPIAAWMDAQRGQVFAALYEPDGRRTLIPPSAMSPEETLASWRPVLAQSAPARFVGDGALRYASLIREHLRDAAIQDDVPALAGIIGLMAAEAPDTAVAPHAVVPIYIRRPDAELARQKRQG